jgi:plastocyanin
MRSTSIAIALLSTAACNGNLMDPGNPPTGDVLIVADAATKGAQAYDPDTLVVSLATHATVKWGNTDGATHTITANGGAFDSGNISPGEGYSHTFATTGTYPYHCTKHPTMVGVLVVNP